MLARELTVDELAEFACQIRLDEDEKQDGELAALARMLGGDPVTRIGGDDRNIPDAQKTDNVANWKAMTDAFEAKMDQKHGVKSA